MPDVGNSQVNSNANGVQYLSPGLVAPATYPGSITIIEPTTLKGLRTLAIIK